MVYIKLKSQDDYVMRVSHGTSSCICMKTIAVEKSVMLQLH
jgi:hypothetical protein